MVVWEDQKGLSLFTCLCRNEKVFFCHFYKRMSEERDHDLSQKKMKDWKEIRAAHNRQEDCSQNI